MTTSVYINDVPLDEGWFHWPVYRGTHAMPIQIYGMAERYEEYKALAQALRGGPAKIRFRSTRNPGSQRGLVTVDVQGVYVRRVVKVNEVSCRLDCYDGRLLLEHAVGAMDFNMKFGDGFLDGTEFDTYKAAIEAYCAASAIISPRLATDAFSRIPDRKLESNVHLSALMQGDPLGYLCERAGCDLVVGLDGLWYFASRADADASWFASIQDENWKVRPGFLSLESVVLQRPRTILSYYWEHHCIRAEGVNATATVSSYGPEATRIELEQVYLDNNEYLTLSELCSSYGLSGIITDAKISEAIFRPSADGSALHPVDTAARKKLWNTIRRDWRRLWRIKFPSGSTGGWDMWRFGKLNADGSVTPVSVECPSVVFKRVVIPDAATGTLEGAPWTKNLSASECPFKAVWADGPESGVIRLVVDDTNGNREDDALPPMPGALQITRSGQTDPDNALRIVWKDEIDNGTAKATVRNLDLMSREDITKARMAASFQVFVYLVARRFMPNDNTRWHSQSNVGFSDGDIDLVELPPADEVNCYRTFVGGTAPAPLGDGLGAILNEDELDADSERRAEVYKLTTHLAEEGEGEAETFNLATRPRIVDGPVGSIDLIVDGVEAKVKIAVGNLADGKAREMIASQRIAKRGVDVQGVSK